MKKIHTKGYVFLCALLMLPFITLAQTGSISGTISDEKNEPLPGASVVLKGLNKGTSTDINGNFRISGLPNGAVTVVATFIGYDPMEKAVTINGPTKVDFQLKPAEQTLGEVVVIGYGTQKKSDLTGSVATVSARDFQKGNITTPEQLIAGKVPGVSITSNSGAPGSGSTIRIRGGASLNASNDPLIVVDGVPLSNSTIPGAPNPLSLINPNDIETFTVLKDASATAIYGSRASNGVVLITTKKGQSGKPSINFSTQYSIAKGASFADILTANEFRDFVNTNGTDEQKALLGADNTDWQDEIYQNAATTDNNLSISGSYKKVPYRASVGYLNQDGILKTGNLERTSASLNLSPSLLDDHLKINLNLKGAINHSRFANTDAIGAAISFDPTKPVYSSSNRFGGYYEWLDPSSVTGLVALAPRNPVGLLNQKIDKSEVQRSIGNIQFDYKFHFLPELRANLNLGYDISKGEGTIFVPDSAAHQYNRYKDPQTGLYHGGSNNRYKQNQDNRLLEFYLNYTKELQSIDSRIEAIAGYAWQDFKTRDYANDNTKNYGYPDVAADGTVITTRLYPYDEPHNKLISYYGRLNYGLKNKYLLTFTVRTDGSSRFNPDNRWAVFPSAALAWRIVDEPFMKNSNSISDLKLRLGYGITGQQEGIGNYDYISYYNLSNDAAQYQLGDNFYNMYRPGGYYFNRVWEETATSNIGLDYGFFDNRITGSLDLYYKKTTNLLNEIEQPAGTNFSNRVIANVGDMENRGLEFNINSALVRRNDLNWSLGFNLTYNKNEITKLTQQPNPNSPGTATGGISGGTGQLVQIHSVGYTRSAFYVYQQVYDAEGKPLDGVFVDRNNDGTINNSDLYHFHGPDPKVFLGLNSNLTYKNWNAGFTARANFGNYIYNNTFSNTGIVRNILNPLGFLNNGSSNVLESGITGSINGDKMFLSDYYLENGSFFRMDNINLGYNFGKVWKGTADLSINANVNNVFIITNYKGVDPEISNGIDNNFYPRPRTFTLGVNVGF